MKTAAAENALSEETADAGGQVVKFVEVASLESPSDCSDGDRLPMIDPLVALEGRGYAG